MRLLCTEFWYVQSDDMLVSFATIRLSRSTSAVNCCVTSRIMAAKETSDWQEVTFKNANICICDKVIGQLGTKKLKKV